MKKTAKQLIIMVTILFSVININAQVNPETPVPVKDSLYVAKAQIQTEIVKDVRDNKKKETEEKTSKKIVLGVLLTALVVSVTLLFQSSPEAGNSFPQE